MKLMFIIIGVLRRNLGGLEPELSKGKILCIILFITPINQGMSYLSKLITSLSTLSKNRKATMKREARAQSTNSNASNSRKGANLMEKRRVDYR